MSDLLAAAAAALGAPEDLVSRSAAARAAADGTSEDAVLAAWAGGAPLPAASADAPTIQPEPERVLETPQEPAASAPVQQAPAAAVAAPAAAATATAVRPRPSATPVLEGQQGRPFMVLLGIAALFAIGLLASITVPASTGGDYTHLVPDATLSQQGETGLDVYLGEGCWYCHTQLVRPVLADVGLGPATETFADSLDTAAFGVARIGPDLAHVGARQSLHGGSGLISAGEIEELLTEPHNVFPDGLHPSYAYLSDGDLAALTTYLLELK